MARRALPARLRPGDRGARGLDRAGADRLDADLSVFFADLDTGPAGSPHRYHYEYLLVLATVG